MKTIYCWRCKENVPLLEGEVAHKFLVEHRKCVEAIKEYRIDTGATLDETPREEIVQPAYKLYEELTGHKPKPRSFDHLPCHRAENFGPECKHCKKPLRSERASFCAECGEKV